MASGNQDHCRHRIVDTRPYEEALAAEDLSAQRPEPKRCPQPVRGWSTVEGVLTESPVIQTFAEGREIHEVHQNDKEKTHV